MAEPLKKGDRYRCRYDECRGVIEVVESAEGCHAETPRPPKCCCGCEMVKIGG